MGTLNNPGQHDCLTKLQKNPDMPYFLLLASDPATPETIRFWAAKSEAAGVDPAKVAEARHLAWQIESWQVANPARVKKPD